MYYLYVITESDGNDARKLDCVIEAQSRDEADAIINAHFAAEAKQGNWEPDGNGGYYFPCDCELPELPEEEIPCPQCEMVSINGVPVHEGGCPIDAKRRRIQRQIDNWECSHGGLDISEPEEFATEEEAEYNCASYHARYYV